MTAISVFEFSLPAAVHHLPGARIIALPAAANMSRPTAATEPAVPEDFLIDIADLDPESCPPDRRYVLSSTREAWVYDHGDIADLVFVKIE